MSNLPNGPSNDQWTSAVSQPFTQFYSVDVSEQDDSRLVGGCQDNGNLRFWGEPTWFEAPQGDGGMDGPHQVFRPERLGEKVDRTGLDRAH